MWKTIMYSKSGRPLIDVNEQGVFYSYQSRDIKALKHNRAKNPYLCFSERSVTHYAHVEVAKAFPEICGEWFEGCEVHHRDGDPFNNEARNLIVCTKDEHIQFHRELKKQMAAKKKKIESMKNRRSIDDVLKEFRNNGKYTVCSYCRKSKTKKDGYAPIEISITQNYKRYFFNTKWKCRPSDFKDGIYPHGFEEYVQSIIY